MNVRLASSLLILGVLAVGLAGCGRKSAVVPPNDVADTYPRVYPPPGPEDVKRTNAPDKPESQQAKPSEEPSGDQPRFKPQILR